MRVQTIFIFISTLLFLFSFSCEDDKKTRPIFADAQQHYLTNEEITLLLPKDFRRSSRYRLNQDMPLLKKDSARLRYIEDELMALEFEDRDIDVFVDTTLDYRFIIILNTEKLSFNREDVAIMRTSVNIENEAQNYNNPSINIGDTKATINNNGSLKMARLTTPVYHKFFESQTYNTTYFLTGVYQTLIIYEFSESAKRIEKYLWASKV